VTNQPVKTAFPLVGSFVVVVVRVAATERQTTTCAVNCLDRVSEAKNSGSGKIRDHRSDSNSR